MPSPLTSSFATAAASSGNENAGSRWNDSPSSNEWSRSRANGSTQTFRRTSTNALRDATQTSGTSAAGPYIPPHLSTQHQASSMRNGVSGDFRYNKDQLLGIYQGQKTSRALDKNLNHLFLGPWDPFSPRNGDAGTWNRTETKDASTGPEVCWNHETDNPPLGMLDATEEERQLFATTVNSPLKSQLANPKEGGGTSIAGGRKTSLSGHNLTNVSAGSGRPTTRRRETSESLQANGPLSPTGTRSSFFRDESSTSTPPPALLRRRTDFRDEPTHNLEGPKDGDSANHEERSDAEMSSLKRSTTGPMGSAFSGPASSPWSAGPSNSAFGPMGTFGSFAVGSSPITQDNEKRSGFTSARTGSRFKDLLAKTSAEESQPGMKQKPSLGNLEKLPEDQTEIGLGRMNDGFKTRPNRSETNPYEDLPVPRSGSAGFSAQQDYEDVGYGVEQLGFSAFGLPVNVGSRDLTQRDKRPESAYQQISQSRYNVHEPMSPTTTNPYQSPPGQRAEEEDIEDVQTSGVGTFGSIRRNMGLGSEERSPTSNSGNTRVLGSIAASSGWPSGGLSAGTPAKDRNGLSSAFGDPIFSPMSDLQSPNLGSFGANSFFGSGGMTNIGRSSKLGALFPPAMQEQMRDDARGDANSGSFGFNTRFDFPSVRDTFDNAVRRPEEASHAGAFFDELAKNDDQIAGLAHPGGFNTSAAAGQSGLPISAPPSGQNAASAHGMSQSSGSSSSNAMPTTQQRQMVMPDRMRWIYRDPSGNTQGPWSGLEMHDWFKAGFFTAELQVKKLEDIEFEPLAQLVRRIGNSREPFLVPQIGVPHGPAPSQGTHWASPTPTGAGPVSAGNAQPPFASSFPSFGTTLTAEQQNALERRKQEEQFLMARQKEHLAQQQMVMKQMQLQSGPHGLHSLQHHGSAQSLHSQPSFGSITSPSGYQPSPLQGPIQPPVSGHMESVMRQGQPSQIGGQQPGRNEELNKLMDRMTFAERNAFAAGSQSLDSATAAAQDRARAQMDQLQTELQTHNDTFLGEGGQNDRLAEFNALRSQPDIPPVSHFGQQSQPIAPPQRAHDLQTSRQFAGAIGQPKFDSFEHANENLSLVQQIQKTQDTVKAAHSAESGLLPVSISPLPAPAAQRNRQHVADALAAESRSVTQTPIEGTSASVAPWAEKTTELSKGPSLKEIQQAEARKAAEQEELAIAARRAQAEQERFVPTLPPAPGLPATSTWGAAASPGSASGPGPSVWAKATIGKPSTASTNGGSKKTLAQIQKEEESRKQRAVAAAATVTAQTNTAAAAAAAGKRYAELASKIAPVTPSTVPSAWTTVGSGGKPKAPVTLVATPHVVRQSSATVPTAGKARPTLQTRTTTSSNQSKAQEEFVKWAKTALGTGLNKTINVDDFVQSLLALPPDSEIISDSVYANSPTLDGRRYAEEFIRRRKLADKGVTDSASSATLPNIPTDNMAAGGWSEVAKKGPNAKEESNFKVVSKKKGKR